MHHPLRSLPWALTKTSKINQLIVSFTPNDEQLYHIAWSQQIMAQFNDSQITATGISIHNPSIRSVTCSCYQNRSQSHSNSLIELLFPLFPWAIHFNLGAVSYALQLVANSLAIIRAPLNLFTYKGEIMIFNNHSNKMQQFTCTFYLSPRSKELELLLPYLNTLPCGGAPRVKFLSRGTTELSRGP